MNGRWPGVKWLLGCLLFVATTRCEAQNLVPNGSFEEADSCSGANQVHYPNTGPLGWFSGGSTPDYYQTCLGSGGSFGVPLSYWAYQFPQDGESFVGVVTYDQVFAWREYWVVSLLTALVPGQTYYASFYANAAFGGPQPQVWLASSGIGMLFTMQARQFELGDPTPIPPNYAQVFHPSILSDTLDWALVSGSFVADSAYQYVVIGNHFDNAHTDTLHFADFAWNPIAYTLIDNVCVSVEPGACPMSTGLLALTMEEARLFPNPAYGEINVKGLNRGARMHILDALGRLMWQGSASSAGTWSLDVGAWSRGVYVLRIMEQGKQKTFKFVLTE